MAPVRRLVGVVWRIVRWPLAAATVAIALLCMPVAYVELACRGTATTQSYTPSIEVASRRHEANTYLTYPEWHIVYAYDGLAETLKNGDEYAFDYFASVSGFWRSSCALMRVADSHGGADGPTRIMIHTIGVSFTLEMALKAAYEETIGHTTAWLRGADKTPQDRAIAKMALDYSAFLRQTPWYRYPFPRDVRALWAAPIDGPLRGWERRLGIGSEFVAKTAYAKVIGAAEAAGEPAPLAIRSIVAGIDRKAFSSMPGVTIIGDHRGGFEIETPRYDLFTRILSSIARQGGSVLEIAGNDDIMVTLTVREGSAVSLLQGTEILRMKRGGFPSERLLVDVKVKDLAAFINAHPLGDPGLEHVFDY